MFSKNNKTQDPETMHQCPRCGYDCDCGGDWDDISVMSNEWVYVNCQCGCDDPDSDDPDYDYPDDDWCDENDDP